MSGKHNLFYEIRCFIMLKVHITNGRNSCLKLYTFWIKPDNFSN